MAWEYKREETQFEQLPEGRYRIRIKSAEKAVSKNGNDMLALQFEVSGNKQILYHYIVFLDDRPEITNRMLTQFFDSFKDIEDGNFDMTKWIGKVGGCQVKHDEDGRARLHYFLRVNQQESLPDWREPDGRKVDKDGFMEIDDDELPDFV